MPKSRMEYIMDNFVSKSFTGVHNSQFKISCTRIHLILPDTISHIGDMA